jgi:hypothetical protein
MNVSISGFGTAPEAKKLGFISLGINVRGTDESVTNTFTSNSAEADKIMLIRGPQLGYTDQYEYFVMKKPFDSTEHDTSHSNAATQLTMH